MNNQSLGAAMTTLKEVEASIFFTYVRSSSQKAFHLPVHSRTLSFSMSDNGAAEWNAKFDRADTRDANDGMTYLAFQ